MRNKLVTTIERQTQTLLETKKVENLTASDLAILFNQKRNTVSKQLNKLWESALFIKINTRPVIFLSKKILESNGYTLTQPTYDSLELIIEKSQAIFDELIGAKASLRGAVQQIESAIMYPGNGLALILFGASGSGKSYIATLAHQFAVKNGCLNENAPFMTLNCAQYADNPELLSSLLFGHIKGAFTGADSEKEGLLAAADGGFLFLDEVHRLSPESQEKLFIFIDKGSYTPVGEVKQNKTANVRLMFATTEAREQFLLTTFIRRIPIQIELPELSNRSERERLELIYTFFKREATILNTTISVSNRVIYVLLNYVFKGNVGELKSTIKYLCAFQYRNKKETAPLVINTSILSREMYPLPENLEFVGPLKNILIDSNTLITQLEGLGHTNEWSKVDVLFDEIITQYKEVPVQLTQQQFIKMASLKVDLMMDSLLFEQPNENNRLLIQMIHRKVKNIIMFLEEENKFNLMANGSYSISNYLFYRMKQTFLEKEAQDQTILELKYFLLTHYAEAHENAKNIILLLENKFDIYLHLKDEILLTFYMINADIQYQQKNKVKALILAHGFATATSLAGVGNRLLDQHIFDAFDMALDSTTQEIGKKVDEYIRKYKECKEFIILVDMGSLQEIQTFIKPKERITLGIINNVTTSMVLEVGQSIINQVIPEMIVEQATKQQVEVKLHLPKVQQQKIVITTCLTGIGTATQIKKLLEASMDEQYGISIRAMDYHTLKNNGISDTIRSEEVLAIIGTDNPEIADIAYIPLEKLISGEDDVLTSVLIDTLNSNEIEGINHKIIKNFSLEKVIESITILDSETVINEIETLISSLEVLFNRKIENKIQMVLYVHISCLIERLIRNQPINGYPIEKSEIPVTFFEVIRKVFSGIEKKYSVTIPETELSYLYSILYMYQ